MISVVKEVYSKIECNCGKGNCCEYGVHQYDDLYVNVQGTWYFVGSFDYDADKNALDRLAEVIALSRCENRQRTAGHSK